jgi:hypothetical protein
LELRGEVEHLRQLTGLYQRNELGGVQPYIAGPVLGPMTIPANGTGSVTSQKTSLVRSLTLGTGTGGRDDDNQPGDEILQVVIVPKDDVGTEVKIPGMATVTAVEFTREGLKQPLGQWEVTAAQLKRAWKGGLLGSGYFVPLQWDRPPSYEKVRVSVRFTATDGGVFEADKDINVQVLPGITPRSDVQPITLPSEPISVQPQLPPLGTKLETPAKVPTVPSPTSELPAPSTLLPLPDFPTGNGTNGVK